MTVAQEVDALNVGAMATPERAKKMDFAYIIWAEPYVMVFPRPVEEPRLFAFIRPFTPIVISFYLFLHQSDLCAFMKCYACYPDKNELKI